MIRHRARRVPPGGQAGGGQNLEAALSGLQPQFRTRLVKDYRDLKDAYVKRQYDSSGLRAGRFSETMLRMLQHQLTGTHIPFGTRIQNFIDECGKLEKLPQATGHESLRVVMPRALAFMYTIRSKRGIGHVGGDIDAHQIDAVTVARIADWCMAELVRVVHVLPLEEAQRLLDAISARELPQVWRVLGKRRVLDGSRDYREQTLLLLYDAPDGQASPGELFDWSGHSHRTVYERNILNRLHRERLVEFDHQRGIVALSPTGTQFVEENLLVQQT